MLLALVVGQSNQTIADSLGISAKTVGHHVEHVYQKAGVRSRAAATVWAFENDSSTAVGRSPDAASAGSRPHSFAQFAPSAARREREENDMILATTTVEDIDQFVQIYSTTGAEKRKLHGSKGSTVFRDPERGGPGLGDLRLGPGGLGELRLRSRGPGDHAARPGTRTGPR